MINFLKWLPALATALAMLLAQRSLMHDFQLESYQFPGYFRTLRRNWKRALLPGVTLAAYLTLLYLALGNRRRIRPADRGERSFDRRGRRHALDRLPR